MRRSALVACAALAAPAAAAGNCTRALLISATDAYVKAQAAGAGWFPVLADNVSYWQNEVNIPAMRSLLSQPIKIDHSRSIHDAVECRTFTELIVTDPKKPYVVGTRMTLDGAKVTSVESLVTTTGDWAFNATGYLHWNSLEHWEPIPEGKRDSRAAIKAAGDAYFDRFNNVNITVPWGVPCTRLEGGAYTGSRNLTIDSCSPAGMPSAIKVSNRRYVVDEVMGVVDIFLGFPGLDRSQPDRPTPDSHMFRVEGGKIRYIHTVSPCFQAGCGMKNSTIPMKRDVSPIRDRVVRVKKDTPSWRNSTVEVKKASPPVNSAVAPSMNQTASSKNQTALSMNQTSSLRNRMVRGQRETPSWKNVTIAARRENSPASSEVSPSMNQTTASLNQTALLNETALLRTRMVRGQKATPSWKNTTAAAKRELAPSVNETSSSLNQTAPLLNQTRSLRSRMVRGQKKTPSWSNSTVVEKREDAPANNVIAPSVNQTTSSLNQTAPSINQTSLVRTRVVRGQEDTPSWKNTTVVAKRESPPAVNETSLPTNQTAPVRSRMIRSARETLSWTNSTIHARNETVHENRDVLRSKNETGLAGNTTAPAKQEVHLWKNETMPAKRAGSPVRNTTYPLTNATLATQATRARAIRH